MTKTDNILSRMGFEEIVMPMVFEGNSCMYCNLTLILIFIYAIIIYIVFYVRHSDYGVI